VRAFSRHYFNIQHDTQCVMHKHGDGKLKTAILQRVSALFKILKNLKQVRQFVVVVCAHAAVRPQRVLSAKQRIPTMFRCAFDAAFLRRRRRSKQRAPRCSRRCSACEVESH